MDLSGYPKRIQAALALCVLVTIVLFVRVGSRYSSPVDAINVPEMYGDAFNRTLGFHRVFVTCNPESSSSTQMSKSRYRYKIEAIAKLVDFEIEFVESISPERAKQLRIQNKYMADDESVAELLTHKRIYATMERRNLGSALILKCDVDVEADLKTRLAAALGRGTADKYDILFVGRTASEPTEPAVGALKQTLDQLKNTAMVPKYANQTQMMRNWIKTRFVHRHTVSYRSTYPRGTHAYALSGRMARRLNRRLVRMMKNEAHDLDFILADIAMVGLSMAYSVSPPPITTYGPEPGEGRQFLRHSALNSISMRKDDPSKYPPFEDLASEWAT
ncbi:hypothetical protein EV175_000453 [Coemansia sp. RSA 1933]|nr:hypothetical protein EV175_000453 [Coemansia sp. RSA 1933]